MEYRKLGTTGMTVSAISLGCEHLQGKEHYLALENRADSCIACGACKSRCPFHVEVTKRMKRATELFGK